MLALASWWEIYSSKTSLRFSFIYGLHWFWIGDTKSNHGWFFESTTSDRDMFWSFFGKSTVWNRNIFMRSLIKAHNEWWWNVMFLHQTSNLVPKSNLVSITALLGISGFPVVRMRLTNPILRKRLWVHANEIRSTHFECSSVLFWFSACATAIIATGFTLLGLPPFLLKIHKKVF